MQTTFYILLNIKTLHGFECFGRFNIGNNRQAAYNLFQKLNGSHTIDERSILCMELMETVDDLPLNIKMISCTLDELTENCRLITKETFNIINLEGQASCL
jgi:hypothetical protein